MKAQQMRDYLDNIPENIEIELPTVSGLSPYVKKQCFTFVSITFRNGAFIMNTSGRYLNSQNALTYAYELQRGADICNRLNSFL